MEHKLRILEIKKLARNVKSYKIEKPQGYSYIPGQATELSIDKPGWENEKRPFTFTSLHDQPFLEFIIKSYKDHEGLTRQLDLLQAGDHVFIGDAWGAIEYKGPGYFIAGGAGITPFIAILRDLYHKNEIAGNKLIFSNNTQQDIICEQELLSMLGKDNIILTLTGDVSPGYEHRYVNKDFLVEKAPDTSKHYYICGPEAMMQQLQESLASMGVSADKVVLET